MVDMRKMEIKMITAGRTFHRKRNVRRVTLPLVSWTETTASISKESATNINVYKMLTEQSDLTILIVHGLGSHADNT